MVGIWSFLRREMRAALPATVFFLVAFHMIAVTRAAALEDAGLTVGDTALATVGALIVAKAILVVEGLPLAGWFAHRRIYSVLWKALLFGLVALLFRLVEEAVRLAASTGSLAALARIGEAVTLPHVLVVQMWLFALLVLYCLAAELLRALGPPEARRLLFGRRDAEEGRP